MRAYLSGRHASWILLLALGAGTAYARDHAACSSLAESTPALWAVADFDGDHHNDLVQLDVAEDQDAEPTVQFGNKCSIQLPPLGPSVLETGLVLSPRDIDSDDDLDLVLHEPFGGRTVGAWVNDGEGGLSAVEQSALPKGHFDLRNMDRPIDGVAPLAEASSSKFQASTPARKECACITTQSERVPCGHATCLLSGWRDSRRSRAPPTRSC